MVRGVSLDRANGWTHKVAHGVADAAVKMEHKVEHAASDIEHTALEMENKAAECTALQRISVELHNVRRHHPGDEVDFAVFKSVNLVFEDVETKAGAKEPELARIIGPDTTLATLAKVLGTEDPVSLRISHRAAITIPMEFRAGAGVPYEAVTFAYIYATDNLAVQEAIHKGVSNKARNPWAFVIEIGGMPRETFELCLSGVAVAAATRRYAPHPSP